MEGSSPSPPRRRRGPGVRRPQLFADQIPSPQPSPRSGGERESVHRLHPSIRMQNTGRQLMKLVWPNEQWPASWTAPAERQAYVRPLPRNLTANRSSPSEGEERAGRGVAGFRGINRDGLRPLESLPKAGSRCACPRSPRRLPAKSRGSSQQPHVSLSAGRPVAA